NIGDILGAFGGAAGDSGEAQPADQDTVDVEPDAPHTAKPDAAAAEKPIYSDPCDHCMINCDRARLGLPAYDEVLRMAKGWRRY
ncbi:MAG: hypothetical protein GX572_06100, partial [Clostridia bacterium]|nr:hypothetical protein [Clostridia bacterium]